jgi:DNA-binding transcriptional MerR regulator
MEKSPEAFRTIREVAEGMALPQHVLRFWETRFPQIKPLKRAGGRRYYRPDDVERLRLIKRLLYDEGYTIKGVQKLFREQGAQALVHNMASAPRQLDPVPTPAPADARERFDPALEAASEANGEDFEPDSERAPLPPARPAISAEDLDALRTVLAGIRQAERILAQARAHDG